LPAAAAAPVVATNLGYGDDLRSELNAKDYQLPFPFRCNIDKLSVHLGPLQLEAADQQKAGDAKVKSGD